MHIRHKGHDSDPGSSKRKNVVAAGRNYLKENNIRMPEIPEAIDQRRETVIFVLIDKEAAAITSLADSIREGAQQAIDALKKMNIESFLIDFGRKTYREMVQNIIWAVGCNVVARNLS